MMKILTKISDVQSIHALLKNSGEKLVFIPTMGALHDGHISLIAEAQKKIKNLNKQGVLGKIIVSIFVNPLQFKNSGNSEDFRKYPNTLESDIKKLEIFGVDYLFLPEISEIYPEFSSPILHKPSMFLPKIFSELEGATRDGHFEGVFIVIKKLFEIVKPNYAVFGQKDFQQVMLIQYLQKKYFNTPENKISIITAPLFRENSGLAYSSRNMRFTQDEKARAVILFEALTEMKRLSHEKKTSLEIKNKGIEILKSEVLLEKIYYISIRDAVYFTEISEKLSPQKGDIILLSGKFSGVHLIDNIII